MTMHDQNLKLLFLCGNHQSHQDLLGKLANLFQITAAETVDQALALLKSNSFDAILSETAGFFPLERTCVSQQALDILNTITEGICIITPQGQFHWQNRQVDELGQAFKEEIIRHALDAFQYYYQLLGTEQTLNPHFLPPRKFSLQEHEQKRFYEMAVTPLFDDQHRLSSITCVLRDQTDTFRMQQRLNAIDKAGGELVRIDAEAFKDMTVEQRISLIQEKIIQNAHELLHFDHFVVRVLNQKTKELEVLFGVDLPGDEQTQVFAYPQNNGITGYVAACGKSYICKDLSSDPYYLPGLDGAKCSLTVPLWLHDRIVGTLNVESTEPVAFDESDLQIAEIFGRYVAIALNILNLLVFERFQTTGQAVEELSHQVSEPLSGIITQASLLMEDYIGSDDIRRRLQEIIDNVVTIKNTVKDAQSISIKGITGIRTLSANPSEADDILSGKHILIVDDEKSIRETICDIVLKYGCIADTAHDGREAIALINQCDYNLIISDIKLPHATGYDIFAAARQKRPDRPVILMTGFGYDPNHSIVRSNRQGLSAVLYKPFKVDQLIAEIRKAIQNPNPNNIPNNS